MKNNTLLLGGIFTVGVALVIIAVYWEAVKFVTPQNSKSVDFSKNPIESSPVKVKIKDGLWWTINPPSFIPCQDLPNSGPSVEINDDETEANMVIPATSDRGLAAVDERGRKLILHSGDKFQVTTSGKIKFANDRPCVGAEGMYGLHDEVVDSPFKEHVGGLEFSIGNLDSNRYFAGDYYTGTAEHDGLFIGRIIERIPGYHDDNSGFFNVRVKKIK